MVKKEEGKCGIPVIRVENDGEWLFDSICVLDEPVIWIDGDHSVKEVYGLLYNRNMEHCMDDFLFYIKFRIASLMGASKNLLHNGDVDYDNNIWILPSGNKINLEQRNIQELIVRLFQDKFSFRLFEFSDIIPFTPEYIKCVNGYLIMDRKLIDRLLPDERTDTKKQSERNEEEEK